MDNWAAFFMLMGFYICVVLTRIWFKLPGKKMNMAEIREELMPKSLAAENARLKGVIAKLNIKYGELLEKNTR